MRGALDFFQSFRGTVLPVDFVNVTAQATEAGNEIRWEVAEQKNVARFEVESFSNDAWTSVGNVNANTYSFTDANVADGETYTYRVVSVDLDGSRTMSQMVNVTRTSSKGFVLAQNYPNPFNPSTTLSFTLAEPAVVTIAVLDVTGKTVAHAVDQKSFGMGTHSVNFDAAELMSGTYVYEMTAVLANGETVKMSRKMTLNK